MIPNPITMSTAQADTKTKKTHPQTIIYETACIQIKAHNIIHTNPVHKCIDNCMLLTIHKQKNRNHEEVI